MSTFAEQVAAFQRKVDREEKQIFTDCVAMVTESIKVGSAITGAPGQPVDTGFLRGSWQSEFTGPGTARVMTNVSYAPAIETGVRSDYDPHGAENPNPSKGPHRPSTVGGHHSVKLTCAAFDRIVKAAVAKVKGA